MIRLPNPALRDNRDARFTCKVEEDSVYRMRFSDIDAVTTGPEITPITASFAVTPHNLKFPFRPWNVQVTGGAYDNTLSLMYPTGPNPADAALTNMQVPVNSPTGIAKYDQMYTRYQVEHVDYDITVFNYEDMDLIFGITVLPLQVVTDIADDGTIRSFDMEDFGNDSYFLPSASTGSRLEDLRTKQNTTMGRIPAAQGSTFIGQTADSGVDHSDFTSHVKPGIAVVSKKIHLTKILMAMAREAGEDGWDTDAYSGVFSTFAEPEAAVKAPVVVWFWCCPQNAFFQDNQGTSTDGDDHWNGLHTENWGSGAVKNWTGKVAIRPSCSIGVRLYDPIITNFPDSGVVDVITAS